MKKEAALSFVLFVLLVVFTATLFWGNFATYFFNLVINGNTPLI